MKKLTLLILIAILLWSCSDREIENVQDVYNNYSYEQICDVYQSRTDSTYQTDTSIFDTDLVKCSNDSLFAAIEMFHSSNKGIYGNDNRHDFYQVKNVDIADNTERVCALIPIELLQPHNSTSFKLLGMELGQFQGLCNGQKFYNDLSVAYCSGFAINDNLIATAGHCINGNFDFAFVFDFKKTSANQTEFIIDKDNVFFPTKEVEKVLNNENDYGVYEVSRTIPHNRITRLSKCKLKVNDRVYVIGHPSGIPQKVAGQSTVRQINNIFARADLDTFGGNSGSPIFELETNEVVGILVRGDVDYINSPNGCRITKLCPQNGCLGEDFTLAKFIAKYY